MNKEITLEDIEQKCKELATICNWFLYKAGAYSINVDRFIHRSPRLHFGQNYKFIGLNGTERVREGGLTVEVSKVINECELFYSRDSTLEDIEKILKEKAVATTTTSQQNVE
ncbi:hypothetical protein [Peptostreptococcus equinus]|uniref:Uncharacterized protein n=1 Tax=Peptostreptococcus equinus TaxID=3003601 RepID=A0ABY7JMN9_9FIRM|nr:hypothetical protein [Peptostreptococcus sp. CBA3647]WAW14634.1 hypothetical protein O0R46_08525 [Peptostreptococcus sp. CBA3647]